MEVGDRNKLWNMMLSRAVLIALSILFPHTENNWNMKKFGWSQEYYTFHNPSFQNNNVLCYMLRLTLRVAPNCNVTVCVTRLPGPLCSVLVNCFGCRPVMMVGGLFASLGMILASFSTSIIHIYLSAGVVTGQIVWASWFTDQVTPTPELSWPRWTHLQSPETDHWAYQRSLEYLMCKKGLSQSLYIKIQQPN